MQNIVSRLISELRKHFPRNYSLP